MFFLAMRKTEEKNDLCELTKEDTKEGVIQLAGNSTVARESDVSLLAVICQ